MTFVSARGIVHVIAHTREAKVIQQFMGDQQRVAEEHPRSSWGVEMRDLFQAAIHLRHKRDDLRKQLKPDNPHEPMNDVWYKRQRTQLENRLDVLLKRHVPPGRAEILRERYRIHRDHLFVFLYDPRVPPTNNACEHALRPSVIHRKVANGFRSAWGTRAYAALSTVIDTAKLKGQAVFDTLVGLMGMPVLHFLEPEPVVNSAA